MQVTSETCRVCLGKKHLNKIFEKDRAEKIKYCASVQLHEDDELPKMICKQCLFYLDIAYIFRTVCETTDIRLRKNFEELKKCAESNNEDDQFFYISSPLVNEIIIGEESVEEVELPIDTLLEENIDIPDEQSNLLSEKNDVFLYEEDILEQTDVIFQEKNYILRQKPVDKVVNPKESAVSEQITEKLDNTTDETSKNEHPIAPIDGIAKVRQKSVDKVVNPEKSEVPEQITEKLDDTTDEISKNDHPVDPIDGISKVGRHTARKKLAKCAKRVPTVEDKSQSLIESKVQMSILEQIPEDGKIQDNEIVKNDEQSKSYQCDECNKSFPYKSHLERHSSVHSGVKEYNCNHCDKKFVNQYNLTVHMQKHTGNFRQQCKECGQGFSSPSVLKRHMNSHSKKATFQCKYCPKKMLHLSSLKLHEKMHMYRPTYTCDICFKVFSYKSSLTEHKKTHQSLKGNVCGVCGKQFTRKTSLRRHMVSHAPKRKHLNVQNKMKCDECHKKFASKELLIKHLKRHLGINNK